MVNFARFEVITAVTMKNATSQKTVFFTPPASTYETKEALMNAVRLYGQNFDKLVAPARLLKEIFDMKRKFPKKTDTHKTGNKLQQFQD